MPITREEVLHVATLCRVHLTEEEIVRMQRQLSDILDQFEVLKELDTEGVSPTGHTSQASVMRPDEPRPSAPREEVLANAPQREGDFFRVPLVLEES